METATALFWLLFGTVLIFAFGIVLLVTRYKRCASDEILLVYGRVGGGRASKCIHGGATLVWPLIQDYKKMKLTPMTINIPLRNALSNSGCPLSSKSTASIWPNNDKRSLTFP